MCHRGKSESRIVLSSAQRPCRSAATAAPARWSIVPRWLSRGGAGAAGTVATKLDGGREMSQSVVRCNGGLGTRRGPGAQMNATGAPIRDLAQCSHPRASRDFTKAPRCPASGPHHVGPGCMPSSRADGRHGTCVPRDRPPRFRGSAAPHRPPAGSLRPLGEVNVVAAEATSLPRLAAQRHGRSAAWFRA
jgi:hypothetical protein